MKTIGFSALGASAMVSVLTLVFLGVRNGVVSARYYLTMTCIQIVPVVICFLLSMGVYKSTGTKQPLIACAASILILVIIVVFATGAVMHRGGKNIDLFLYGLPGGVLMQGILWFGGMRLFYFLFVKG